MEDKDRLQALLPDIRTAARTVAYKWPTVTTSEDMTQDLVLHFIERKGSAIKLSEMEVGERRAALVRVGHQLAAAMRDDFEVFSGQYRYSVDDVKAGLSKGALKGKDSLNVQSGDLVQALVALNKKNPEQGQAIVARYLNEVRPQSGADKMVLSRGIENLTRLMNRADISEEYDYENGGRFRNNRSAISQVDLDYDGEARFDD